MTRPGIWNSVKNWGKKAADKVGKFVQKTTKEIRKYQPLIDKITDFIPNVGDEIDKYIDMGLNAAEKIGEGLEDIGKGKNVIKTAAQKAMEYLNAPMGAQSSSLTSGSNKPSKPNQPSFLGNKLN